jgi:hypothetical protein
MPIVATSKTSAVLAVDVQFLPSRNFDGTENPIPCGKSVDLTNVCSRRSRPRTNANKMHLKFAPRKDPPRSLGAGSQQPATRSGECFGTNGNPTISWCVPSYQNPTAFWRCGEKSRNNAAHSETWLVACGAWLRVVVSAVGNLTFLLPLPCRTRHPAGFSPCERG